MTTHAIVRTIFTETIQRYIDSNAGMFASEADAYIPGIVEELLAALAAHKLQITTTVVVPPRPTTPSVS